MWWHNAKMPVLLKLLDGSWWNWVLDCDTSGSWTDTCTLGWPYTERTWLYCDYFIWCVSCTVVILTGFVMCGWFGNICTCIYCFLYCLYCIFVLFRLCVFILICFVWKFEEETNKMLHLEHSFVWCWNLDASGSRLEIPGKFWNVVLEKDGDQLDRSCEKWRSVT